MNGLREGTDECDLAIILATVGGISHVPPPASCGSALTPRGHPLTRAASAPAGDVHARSARHPRPGAVPWREGSRSTASPASRSPASSGGQLPRTPGSCSPPHVSVRPVGCVGCSYPDGPGSRWSACGDSFVDGVAGCSAAPPGSSPWSAVSGTPRSMPARCRYRHGAAAVRRRHVAARDDSTATAALTVGATTVASTGSDSLACAEPLLRPVRSERGRTGAGLVRVTRYAEMQ